MAVGPHALCGVHVFYRKLLTYLVLVLYGVPTALGPFWHRHDHVGGHAPHGDACETCVVEPAHATAAHQHCGCSHDACQSDARVAGLVVQRQMDLVSLDRAGDCHGACAICQFYACPPLLVIDRPRLQAVDVVGLVSVDSQAAVVVDVPQTHARGPPCTL